MTPRLSIVVPCYNEEKRFQSGFNHYFSYLSKRNYLWELILVDDGSSDSTLKLMKKSALGKKGIKVINYVHNHGKGYAISKGVTGASGQYILFTDIDHSVPISTIENFYQYFEKGHQVVIGSRRVKGAKILNHQNPFRELLGRGFSFLVRLFINWQIRDATCGFKAFKYEAAQRIFNKITIYDWAFDAELLFLCKKYNILLAQAPVAWRDVRGSKVSIGRDIIHSLVGLAKIRINDLMGQYST